MSRNGSGTYSVPNTFVSGTPITAADHNENWTDVATEMTNSVAADGQTPMTGTLRHANGTVSLPSVTFASDTDTGLYRIGSNNVGLALGGTKVIDANTTGVAILGTTTNDSAATGFVGEYVSGTLAIGSAATMTSGLTEDITSISLTAGDWDVYGTVGVTPLSGTPTVQVVSAWISTTSASEPTDPNDGAKAILYHPNAATGDNRFAELTGLRKRVLISSTTTVYLSMQGAFSGGLMGRYGFIGARRVR